jgi:hypothetical protein
VSLGICCHENPTWLNLISGICLAWAFNYPQNESIAGIFLSSIFLDGHLISHRMKAYAVCRRRYTVQELGLVFSLRISIHIFGLLVKVH